MNESQVNIIGGKREEYILYTAINVKLKVGKTFNMLVEHIHILKN